MNHNIFRFATKELSQDAFLAWLISWANEEADSRIKALAKEFLEEIIPDENWKALLKADKCQIDVEVQFFHIDVLAMLYDKTRDTYLAVVIEDKVLTQEHGEQIQRYQEILRDSLEKVERYADRKDKIEKIVTCYYKPYDECGVEEKQVDCIFTRERILGLMEKYADMKQEYFQEYLAYIQAIDECAQAYTNEAVCSEIVEKRKKDIKSFAFFKELEKEHAEYRKGKYEIENVKIEEKVSSYYAITPKQGRKKTQEEKIISITKTEKSIAFLNEKVYFGKDTEGYQPTWWCNIPIDCKIKSLSQLNPYGYIKINFYEKPVNDKEIGAKVSIRFGKRYIPIEDKETYQRLKDANKKEETVTNAIRYYQDGKEYNIFEQYNSEKINNKDLFARIENSLKGCSKDWDVTKPDLKGKGGKTEFSVWQVKIPNSLSLEEQTKQINDIIKEIRDRLAGKEFEI